jgi:hypothetical protein
MKMDYSKQEKAAEKAAGNKDLNNLEMFCYYDEKSDYFDVPFFSRDATNAKRKFQMDAQKESVLATFSSDFSLYRVGVFNLKEGIVRSSVERLMKGKELQK